MQDRRGLAWRKATRKAIYIGAHLREEIRSLILKLSYTMNNYRLSTSDRPVEYLNKDERDQLIDALPALLWNIPPNITFTCLVLGL